LMSPTSKGLHSYEFVMVDDKEQLTALAQCKSRGAELIAGASLAVVVLADTTVSDVWVEDASVASTVLLLQAEDLGLGACWVQVRQRFDEMGNSAEENVRDLLGIPKQMGVVSIVALGHKGMERKPQNEDKLLWEKVHVGQW
ncbi:MAG: nitroreductase family protein, partial [Bacteroidaceae bacterium]|nr:nitroreductase family protein [Bacteroidaceae bacterium]